MTHYRYSKSDKSLYPQPEVGEPVFGEGYDAFDRQLNYKLLLQAYNTYKSSILKVEGSPTWRDNHFVTEGVHFYKKEIKAITTATYVRGGGTVAIPIPAQEQEWMEKIKDILPCTCGEIYTSRRLSAPDCPQCNYADDVYELLKPLLSSPSPLKEELTEREIEMAKEKWIEGNYYQIMQLGFDGCVICHDHYDDKEESARKIANYIYDAFIKPNPH